MNKTYLLAVAAALVAAPMAFAHSDGGVYGTPKIYCEDTIPGETYVHDYGPPSTGFLIGGALDASVPPCPYDPQWDGHYEWAIGGAFLLACEGPCPKHAPYCLPDKVKCEGDGSLACWGTYSDHSSFPDIWVFDHVLGTLGLPVVFTVGADYWDNVPPVPEEPNCGDFETDYTVTCINHCKVDFPPGKDGSYQVFVEGTFGHVWST